MGRIEPWATYNAAVSKDSLRAGEAEIEAVLVRLREEVREQPPARGGELARVSGEWRKTRGTAGSRAHLTAERPYLYRPGTLGRLRGLALVPLKAVLRRLMKWYVEPLAIDQSYFNRLVLQLLDELEGQTARVAELEERLAALEGRDNA